MKKLLSLLLAMMMLASCIPAFADATWKISPEGALTINSDVKLSGEVVIPETVDGITVTSIGNAAFNNQTGVTSIVMPDTVQSLGGNAINFLDGVTSLKLSENLTMIEDMNGILKGLTELTVPASVRYIGDSFTSMKSIQTLTFEGVCPFFNSDDPLYGINSNCVIYVPDDQVDAYKAALAGDYDVDDQVQPSGKNAVVYSKPAVESDFAFDAATGTITGYTGVDAYLQIPATIGGTPVKAIGENAFYDNAAIFYVSIPEGVESVGNYAFNFCDNLTVVEFPTTLKKIGDGAFDGCYLDYIGWAEGLEEIGANAFPRLAIRSITLPSTVKSIGEAAFKGGSITKVYLGKELESIGPEAFANNFIDRLELLVDHMIQIDETAFAGNTSETTVLLRWNTAYDVYKDYEHLFMDIYPGYVYLYIQAPIKDPSLGLEYPADGTDSYNQDVWVSYNGTQPNLMTWYSWNRIPITTLGDGLFKGNQTIRSWYPSHEFTMHHIGNEAFADSSVEIVDLFHEIHTIGDAAFRNCVNIREITLPETLTSIAPNAFEGCTGLEKITILCDPSVIPEGLLDTCTALKEYSAGPDATEEENLELRFALFGMPEVNIIQQPADVTVADGEMATATVQAEGEGLTYAWYYGKDGNFNLSEDNTGDTYSVEMNDERSGRQVYCVVTDAYGTSATSDIATLRRITPLKLREQPMSVTAAAGANASMYVVAGGDGLSYQWFINDAPVEGSTAESFSIAMAAEYDGAQVHCVVTDAYGSSVSSDKATLKLAAELAITAQPMDAELPEGEMTHITVEATGDGLSYQWYVMPGDAGDYIVAEGFTTNVYSVAVDASSDWSSVYCEITDAYGNKLTSDKASIFMAAPAVEVPAGEVDPNMVGRWVATGAEVEGMVLDQAMLEQFGMNIRIDLNADGTAVMFMQGEEMGGISWIVAEGVLYLTLEGDTMPLPIGADGTINFEGVIIEKEASAEAAPVEEAAAETTPVAAANADAADIVGTWNVVSGETDGMQLDRSMLEMFGMGLIIELNADGTGMVILSGEEGAVNWTYENGALLLDSEGDVINATYNADGTISINMDGVLLVFEKEAAAEETPVEEAPADEMSDEDALLALLELLEEMDETEAGEEVPAEAEAAAAETGAEGFVGTWYMCYINTGGLTGDMRPMGINSTLVLRDDGNGSIDFPEAIEGVWYEENGFTYFGEGGESADMPMALLDGGFLQYGSDLGGYLIFSQDPCAEWDPAYGTALIAPGIEAMPEPTAAPAAPAEEIDKNELMERKFVATTYTSFGQTMDASMLGAEYSVYFREDGTCDFTLGGAQMPNLPWSRETATVAGVEAEAFAINFYGTMFYAVLTNTGFDMDYYGTMTLHFVPAE